MCSPGTTEDFAVALRRCMSGEAAAPGGVGAGADKGGAGTETKRKLIQGEEGGDRRKAFGQVENVGSARVYVRCGYLHMLHIYLFV